MLTFRDFSKNKIMLVLDVFGIGLTCLMIETASKMEYWFFTKNLNKSPYDEESSIIKDL